MEPELKIKEIKRSKQSKKNVESKLRRMKRKNKSSAGSGSLLNAQPQNLLEIEGVICGEFFLGAGDSTRFPPLVHQGHTAAG